MDVDANDEDVEMVSSPIKESLSADVFTVAGHEGGSGDDIDSEALERSSPASLNRVPGEGNLPLTAVADTDTDMYVPDTVMTEVEEPGSSWTAMAFGGSALDAGFLPGQPRDFGLWPDAPSSPPELGVNPRDLHTPSNDLPHHEAGEETSESETDSSRSSSPLGPPIIKVVSTLNWG